MMMNLMWRHVDISSLFLVEASETISTETVHTSAKERLNSVVISVLPSDESVLDRHQNLVICSELFIGPLPTFPENFMQIRSEVFEQNC